jgi:prephenate dehydratase
VELAGHAHDPAVAAALSQLCPLASSLKVLGSYTPGTTSTALASIPAR